MSLGNDHKARHSSHSGGSNTDVIDDESSILLLTEAFIRGYPAEAARELELLSSEDTVRVLIAQSELSRRKVWCHLNLSTASRILPLIEDSEAIALIEVMELGATLQLLKLLHPQQREHYLAQMRPSVALELTELLSYPPNCAGYIMDNRIVVLDESTKAADALSQLKQLPTLFRRRLYVSGENNCLLGHVDLEKLIFAGSKERLSQLMLPVKDFVSPLDPIDEVAEELEKNNIDVLPVVSVHNQIMGVIRGAGALEALQSDLASDLQAMVGASREERALSSSWFAVKKRQGWLQINLLTGFLAAAVVGMFESTIAQFTALAILMPIAAGQSGNTGAQALAVTMRGLTLREITTGQWWRVMVKEAGAGLFNGIAIAITCGLGVFLWSRSFGLALVIALAMIISMTIAGIAGALVPLALKKIGQDPAQSSSIILTTITDIAGFMSFLGIATLLSNMLTAG